MPVDTSPTVVKFPALAVLLMVSVLPVIPVAELSRPTLAAPLMLSELPDTAPVHSLTMREVSSRRLGLPSRTGPTHPQEIEWEMVFEPINPSRFCTFFACRTPDGLGTRMVRCLWS